MTFDFFKFCNVFYVQAVDVYDVYFLMASWSLIRNQWLVLIGMQRKNHKKNKQLIKQNNNGFTATLPKILLLLPGD